MVQQLRTGEQHLLPRTHVRWLTIAYQLPEIRSPLLASTGNCTYIHTKTHKIKIKLYKEKKKRRDARYHSGVLLCPVLGRLRRRWRWNREFEPAYISQLDVRNANL